MRCGATFIVQNYNDMDRYEADERGEDVPPVDAGLDNSRFSEEIDTALQIEDYGFDSLWTIEHHVMPYAMVTNPIQLLSFFAGVTKRIDVGTMVTVLPWHHPLRVAEDMIMLQQLLRGRTPYIGVGRGAGRREFGQFGFDMNESRQRFIESVEIIKLALSEEKFSYSGQHYQFEDVTLRPRPLDGAALIDAMHFAWGSPASAGIGSKLGLTPLVIPQKPLLDYLPELEGCSKIRSEIGLPPVKPRVGSWVYVAETEAEAEEGARRWLGQYGDSANRAYELYSGHFADVKGYEFYAGVAAEGGGREAMSAAGAQAAMDTHIWGTPDQCIKKIQQVAQTLRPEEMMMVTRFGDMTKAEGDRNLDLFAREVLPAMKEMKCGPAL